MTQQSTEDRLAALEHDVAVLKEARRIQEDRDIALLARIDTFIEDLHRIERVQMRSFEDLMAGQNNTASALASVSQILNDHKSAIETLGARMNNVEDGQRALQVGQEQIIAILTGRPPRND